MEAVRKVYEHLPDSISVPLELRKQKAEVIILTFNPKDSPHTQSKKDASILDLAGGLEKSSLALKDPLELQKELRNEWD
jgi:hypothetical protein